MSPGLWLCDTRTDRAIPLEPLLVRATCPKGGARERFVRTGLDELELRSPASGHVCKKPIDAMPLPPQGRERLTELVRPAPPDGQIPRAPEAAGRITLQLPAPVVCVVGVSGAIRDDAARSFAISFHGGLGERESSALAYRQGCAPVSLEGLRDADRPQLKVRTGMDASRLVLATERP